MNNNGLSDTQLVAPCGINCRVCLAYLREKNKCSGCRAIGDFKVKHCNACRIKNCEYLPVKELNFCYDCTKYPCAKMKQLDKRYRTKYKMSVIGNLSLIKDSGLVYFTQVETEKWKCKACGGVICVHRGYCLSCGSPRIGIS
ncbi:MAG TPA: DUF3795 domain-containing protein [Bacteroidales bacterium]